MEPAKSKCEARGEWLPTRYELSAYKADLPYYKGKQHLYWMDGNEGAFWDRSNGNTGIVQGNRLIACSKKRHPISVLSTDAQDTYSWNQAKSKCEARGERLPTRYELSAYKTDLPYYKGNILLDGWQWCFLGSL